MTTHPSNSHDGVSCDGCNATAFSGNRFKCLRCNDYDLCFSCFTAGRYGDQPQTAEVISHDATHPMQMIMTPSDFEMVYSGDATKNYDQCKIASFTCPYCNTHGFSMRTFGVHVTTVHIEPPSYNVICPVCIGTPDMEHSTNRDTANLKAHWNDFHSQMFDTYRPEPVRGVTRRPMLARRTQNRPDRNRASLTAPLNTWATDGMDLSFGAVDFEEILRITRMPGVANNLEMQRNASILQDFMNARDNRELRTRHPFIGLGAPFDTRSPLLARTGFRARAQNATPLLSAESRLMAADVAAISAALGGAAPSTAQPTPQFRSTIRALPSSPVYQPIVESDTEESDEKTAAATSSICDLPLERAPLQPPSQCHKAGWCDCDAEFEIQLGEASDDDEYEVDDDSDSDTWNELRQCLGKRDLATLKRAVETVHDEGEGQKREPTTAESDGPSGAARTRTTTATTTTTNTSAGPQHQQPQQQQQQDDSEQQAWLPLRFESPAMRTHGCGQYWADKRFLRQRQRYQREQSVATSNREQLQKAEVALAICRAAFVEDVPRGMRTFDRPDRLLRVALRGLDLGRKPDLTSEIVATDPVDNEIAQAIPPPVLDSSGIVFMMSPIIEGPSNSTPHASPDRIEQARPSSENLMHDDVIQDENAILSSSSSSSASSEVDEDDDDDDDVDEVDEEADEVASISEDEDESTADSLLDA